MELLTSASVRFFNYLLTERRVAHNTFLAYKLDIDQLSTFLAKHKITCIDDITLALLKQYVAVLHKRGITPKSMVRKLSSIKGFVGYCARTYDIPNVSAGLIFPKVPKRLPRFLSHDEIEELFAVADQADGIHALRNKVMLYLLYVTGMRVSELIALRVTDLHPDTNTVTVSGKGGKQRLIPVPMAIMQMVQTYTASTGRMQLIAAGNAKKKNRSSEFLFVTHYKDKVGAITRQAFFAILNGLWKKTGNDKTISPHKLRHSFATHMLKNGAHLRSLQLLLGHESLSTVQIYTHIDTSYARTLYDKKHKRS